MEINEKYVIIMRNYPTNNFLIYLKVNIYKIENNPDQMRRK